MQSQEFDAITKKRYFFYLVSNKNYEFLRNI